MASISCGEPDTSFIPEPLVTDPYCEDSSVWREALIVSATYTDPDNRDEISVHLKTTEDLVEIPGDVTIEGASANFVYYDVDTFWYALSPDEGADEIVFRGTLKCTTEEILFIVVLTLSPDSDDIDYRIEFPEPDAGSGAADAGE